MSPIRKALRSGGMFFFIPLLIGCGGGEEVIPSASRLSTDVQPIFTARCALSGCHDSATRRAGLDLSEGNAYTNLVNVNSSQNASWKRVVPGSPQESLLYLKVSQDSPPVGGRMPPPPRSALTAEQQDKIRDWILQGAQNN